MRRVVVSVADMHFYMAKLYYSLFREGRVKVLEDKRVVGVASISEHTFFLEVDRSSETQDTLLNRASCYLDHYKSGGFAVQNDAPRSAYKEFPFRVLIVLKNAERRNNTAERLLQSNPPILTLAYLSTFAEVTANPIGPIWVRPSDYRDALIQTDFNKGTQATVYRRQAKREALVEQSVKKVSLFESN